MRHRAARVKECKTYNVTEASPHTLFGKDWIGVAKRWIVVGGVGAVVQPTEGARAPRAPNFARALGLLRAVAEAIELTFPVEGAIRTCSNPASRLARLRLSLRVGVRPYAGQLHELSCVRNVGAGVRLEGWEIGRAEFIYYFYGTVWHFVPIR